jgi:hypothetical protein
MKIIENFLSDNEHQDLTKLVTSSVFDWYYIPYTSYSELHSGSNVTESGQFVHTFFHNKQTFKFMELMNMFKDKLIQHGVKPTNLSHMKANMLIKDSSYPANHFHPPHSDVEDEDKFCTLLYYLNDSDGDTYMFNQTYNNMPDFKNRTDELVITKRITPKANTAVIFDSTIIHTSSSPRETDRRMVVNCVFET